MAPQALCHLLSPPLASSSSSPARLFPILPFLLCFISAAIGTTAGAVPQGLRKLETNINGENENQFLRKLPLPDPSEHDIKTTHMTGQVAFSDGRNDCYAFEFSKNMSTLLAEASHMLGRVKNSRERNWLKGFIRRLTSLADDLQEYPEAKKLECLRKQSTKSKELKQSPMVVKSKNSIFKDQALSSYKSVPARSHKAGHVKVENPSPLSGELEQQNQSSLITKPETNQRDVVTEEMLKIDGGSKLDNSDDLVQQLRIGPPGITDSTVPQQAHPRGMIDVKVWKPPKTLYGHTKPGSSKRGATSPEPLTLKGEALQKLLGEMASQVQKLKDLGGSEEDILNLWNESGTKPPLPVVEVTPSPDVEQDVTDFGYDEQGAATGELRADDNQQDLIVAPSFNKVESTMSSIPIVSSSSHLETMNEFYPTSKPPFGDQGNDEDDLVRQLQEEKFLSDPMKATPDQKYSERDEKSNAVPDGGDQSKRFDVTSVFG